jgi:hypothetical protein
MPEYDYALTDDKGALLKAKQKPGDQCCGMHRGGEPGSGKITVLERVVTLMLLLLCRWKVDFQDGSHIDCQMVIVCTGIKPRDEVSLSQNDVLNALKLLLKLYYFMCYCSWLANAVLKWGKGVVLSWAIHCRPPTRTFGRSAR